MFFCPLVGLQWFLMYLTFSSQVCLTGRKDKGYRNQFIFYKPPFLVTFFFKFSSIPRLCYWVVWWLGWLDLFYLFSPLSFVNKSKEQVILYTQSHRRNWSLIYCLCPKGIQSGELHDLEGYFYTYVIVYNYLLWISFYNFSTLSIANIAYFNLEHNRKKRWELAKA